MQRKIYRLLATDFCCWVPISIMAFVNFSGVPLPDIAYAISAIVLLPINSALNPILYSDVFDKLFDKTVHKINSSTTWITVRFSKQETKNNSDRQPPNTCSDHTKL